jgi:uncharacterized HAD superfamily protein
MEQLVQGVLNPLSVILINTPQSRCPGEHAAARFARWAVAHRVVVRLVALVAC